MRTRPPTTPSAVFNQGGLTPGCQPGVNTAPTAHAATGYASKYPPVGPNNRATPTSGTVGVNTGSPAAPIARYRIMLSAPSGAPSRPPTSSTASGWSVIGTGVPGSGTDTCAAAATTSAPTTTAAARRMINVE